MRGRFLPVQRSVAVLLCSALLLSAPGQEGYRAFAQNAVRSRAGARHGLQLPVSSLPGLRAPPPRRASPAGTARGLPAALFTPARLIPADSVDGAASPPPAVTAEGGLFGVMLRRLAEPPAEETPPTSWSPERSRAASESEFSRRLGGAGLEHRPADPESPSRAEAAGAIQAARASSLGLKPGPFSGSAPRPVNRAPQRLAADVRPEPVALHRSVSFPAVLAALFAATGAAAWAVELALQWAGSGASAAGAGDAWSAGAHVVSAALGAATVAGLGAGAMFAAEAALELGAFLYALLRGRGVSEEELRASSRRELLRLGLPMGTALSLADHAIKPSPASRRSLSFAFTLGRAIYVRPELARVPWLYRRVLKHELAHFFSQGARAPPPASGFLRAWLHRTFLPELYSRGLSDLGRKRWLGGLRVPVLERVLRQTGLSLRFGAPYEILLLRESTAGRSAPGGGAAAAEAVDSGGEEWEDPGVYRELSDGRAALRPIDLAASGGSLAKALSSPERRSRYRAMVLPQASLRAPSPRSDEGRRLKRAFENLDRLYVLSQRALAATGKGHDASHAAAERVRRWGGRDMIPPEPGVTSRRQLEETLSDVWHQVATSYLRNVGMAQALEGLYASLKHKGVAFIPWPESEPGLGAAEKLLRYWRGKDRGHFRVERVDLPEGGHVLVARKNEPRVNLWLKPQEGGRVEESFVNLAEDPSFLGAARQARVLREAGFSQELIDRFRSVGMEIKHVFGRDVGMDRIYVGIPKIHAATLRRFSEDEKQGFQMEASQGGFRTHLIESGPMQNAPRTWKLGYEGQGGRIYDIDTGLDVTHPDFANKMAELGVDDLVQEGPEDWGEHGTFKASEEYADGPRYKGMAPKAVGRMGKVFARDGAGASDGDIMAAAVLAMKWGADVVSLSVGSPGEADSPLAQFFSNLTRRTNAKGHKPIVTASAGNSGPFDRTLSQPSTGRMVISVAAAIKSLADGIRSIGFFSAVGAAAAGNGILPRLFLKPDIAALGGDVTTPPAAKDPYRDGIVAAKSRHGPPSPSDEPDGLHRRMSGTSMSNPMVAAVAFLVKQAVLAATREGSRARAFFLENLPFTVKMILMRSSRDMGAPIFFQGAGFLDALAAVRLAMASFQERDPGPIGRGLRRLGLLPAHAGSSEGYGWIARVEEIWDIEDRVYSEAEAAADGVEDKQRAHTAAQKRFNELKGSDWALPNVLRALEDPVWIVRLYAAFTLINFQAAAALPALSEAALNDADARVRQTAFLAIAATPGRGLDPLLREVALGGAGGAAGSGASEEPAARMELAPSPPVDVPMYAAYALARHGDGSAVARILAGLGHADKHVRFTAAWLLGQLGRRADAACAAALGNAVADESEQGNVRHLSAASLSNLARDFPEGSSDGLRAKFWTPAILALLSAAGVQNLALTRTVSKFFGIAAQRKELVASMRGDALQGPIRKFILDNKSWAGKPGPLGELVDLLARILGVPMEGPQPRPMTNGLGVRGVDPNLGPIHMIVEAPGSAERVRRFAYFAGAEGAKTSQALAEFGLNPEEMRRHEATLQASYPVSNALWFGVPEHKVVAFSAQMEARGYRVRRARPVYKSIHETRIQSGIAELSEKFGMSGEGVTVVVLDEGFDLGHPAMPRERVLHAMNFTEEGGPGEVGLEEGGHGSFVAGIIAARSVDGSPYEGLAPGASLIFGKVLGAEGGSEAMVMAGLEWAASLVKDPLETPVLINMSLGGPGPVDGPLSRLATKLALMDFGLVAAAGNAGPKEGPLESPANAPLVAAVGAVDKAGNLANYSQRGTPEEPGIRRVNFGGKEPFEIVSLLATALAEAAKDAAGTVFYKGKALYQMMSGTSMAAPHETAMQAGLTGELAKSLRKSSGKLPKGWWLWLNALLDRTAGKLERYREHEVGAGLTRPLAAWPELREALQNPAKIRVEAEALSREAWEQWGAFASGTAVPGAGFQPRPAARSLFGEWARALPTGGLFATGALALAAARISAGLFDSSSGRKISSGLSAEPANLEPGSLKELKQALGDGTLGPAGRIEPFSFHAPSGARYKARSAGLEGFLYSKLELERSLGPDALMGQLDDFFKYLDALLLPLPWAAPFRKRLDLLRKTRSLPSRKNAELNQALIEAIGVLRETIPGLDASWWGRRAAVYMILARAYNKLKPGGNFFDSLDDEELTRIRDATRSNMLWLLDIFEIGRVRRWGSGGGSPYSLVGYRIKDELGGEKAFKRLIARAHALGLGIMVDFIPNHVSLDSDMLREHPEAFLHIVPPQPRPGEDEPAYLGRVMAGVPREPGGGRLPVFYPVLTERYPEGGRRVRKWILVQHPRTDYGETMWGDMAQVDYSHPTARAWVQRELLRLLTELGVDAVRRDMAYEILNARFYPRWRHILSRQSDGARGWARKEIVELIGRLDRQWAELGGEEFWERVMNAVRAVKPEAWMIDEAYGNTRELSPHSGGIYNKNDHDVSMGQVGLYDALVSGDAPRIREALGNAAFRLWQRGGAALVHFMGNHDEGNPVDKFKKRFKAVAATAMLLRPVLVYNGSELGVGQKAMLLGDLSRSEDTKKAIPFDIPVRINWNAPDEGTRDFLKRLWAFGDRHRDLLAEGSMQVLDPLKESPIVAASFGSRLEDGSQKALIWAANHGESRAGEFFPLRAPVLEAFGAFRPRADRGYRLRDHARPGPDGTPAVYERSGRELLDKGLYLELDGGEVHLFGVEEFNPAAPAQGPPDASIAARGVIESDASSRAPRPSRLRRWLRAPWPVWAERMTHWASGAFAWSPVSQIWTNFVNMAGNGSWAFYALGGMNALAAMLFGWLGVSWRPVSPGEPAHIGILSFMGYLGGILANLILLAHFVSSREKAASIVQVVGVLGSSAVLAQMFLAAPAAWTFGAAAAAAGTAAFLAAGLALSWAMWRGILPASILRVPVWETWQKALVPLGFAVLSMGITRELWSLPVSASAWVGAAGALAGASLTAQEGLGRMSERLRRFWKNPGAKLATALFMSGNLFQLARNYHDPSALAGISVSTVLFCVLGNLLMLPKASWSRDAVWFTGGAWGVSVGGLGILLSLCLGGALSWIWFPSALSAIAFFFAFMLHRHRTYSAPSSLADFSSFLLPARWHDRLFRSRRSP